MYSIAAFNLLFRARQYRDTKEVADRRNADTNVRTIDRLNADILFEFLKMKSAEIIGAGCEPVEAPEPRELMMLIERDDDEEALPTFAGTDGRITIEPGVEITEDEVDEIDARLVEVDAPTFDRRAVVERKTANGSIVVSFQKWVRVKVLNGQKVEGGDVYCWSEQFRADFLSV